MRQEEEYKVAVLSSNFIWKSLRTTATFPNNICQLPVMPSHNDLSMQEQQLVRAVLKGNVEAFRELVRRHEKLVTGIVFRMIHHQHDREDLCQDIFLTVYEKLSSFRFGAKLSTWIGAIAFNRCINFLKAKKYVLPGDDEDANEGVNTTGIDLGPKADEVLIKKQMEAALEKSIAQLPLLQQTALQLFHFEELSLEEMATIMNMPVNTVKSHLSRARKNLKDRLLLHLKN